MNTARSASSRQLVVLNSLIRIASPLSPCRNFPFIAPRLNSPQELFVLNELRRIPAETHLCTVTSHGSSAGHCLFMVETVSAGPPTLLLLLSRPPYNTSRSECLGFAAQLPIGKRLGFSTTLAKHICYFADIARTRPLQGRSLSGRCEDVHNVSMKTFSIASQTS